MSDSPLNIIIDALNDLGELASSFDRDLPRLQQEFTRWRSRVLSALRSDVSANEAREFDDLRIQPSWVSNDNFDVIIDEHRAFLESLHNDILRRPEQYGRKVAESEVKAERKRQKAVQPAPAQRQGSFRQRVENHPVVFAAIIAIAAFAAGWQAHRAVQESGGMVPVSRLELDSLRKRSASNVAVPTLQRDVGDTLRR